MHGTPFAGFHQPPALFAKLRAVFFPFPAFGKNHAGTPKRNTGAGYFLHYNSAVPCLSRQANKNAALYRTCQTRQFSLKGRRRTRHAVHHGGNQQADDILTHQDYGILPLYWPQLQFVAKENVHMKCGNLIYHFNDVTMD